MTVGYGRPGPHPPLQKKENKQELMWTSDKLQWTDKHIQALKLEKIV